jgi:hypothetical protein
MRAKNATEEAFMVMMEERKIEVVGSLRTDKSYLRMTTY